MDADVVGLATTVFVAVVLYGAYRLARWWTRTDEPDVLPNISPGAMRRLTDRVDRERAAHPERQS